MDLHTSLWLFQAIQAVGLALWLSIAVLNNLQAFASSVGAIGATLAMAPLRQPPAIDFPCCAGPASRPAWPAPRCW